MKRSIVRLLEDSPLWPMKRSLTTFVTGLLFTAGCLITPQTPIMRAPSVQEEVETLEVVTPVLRDATGRIRKATTYGRTEAPELSQWEKIDDAAYDIEAATGEIEITAISLSKDQAGIGQYEDYVAGLSKEKQILASQIKQLKSDQTRGVLTKMALLAGGLVAMGVLVFWIEKKWGVILAMSGIGLLLLTRVITRMLAVFDIMINVGLVMIPILIVGYLAWRYRSRLAQLIKSVQKAKGTIDPASLDRFRTALSAEQDNSLKQEITKVKKELTRKGEISTTPGVETPPVSSPER